MRVTKYITLICDELDAIISDNAQELKHAKYFKIRTGIAYDKFYMDRVEGSYDQSLHGLIHHLMWERKYYHDILPESQISVVSKMVKEEPEGIYRPDHDDLSISLEQCEELDDALNDIYFNVIKHVGNQLKEFDFFDDSEFVSGGYID
jgi:hypothetical protein